MPDTPAISTRYAAPLRWQDSTGRYRDGSGRFVRFTDVEAALQRGLAEGASRLRGLAEGVREGTVALSALQRAMIEEIKRAHLVSAGLARGGLHRLTTADLAAVSRMIRSELGYAQRMAVQVASGQQPLDGRFIGRVLQYSRAGRETYYETRGRELKERGYDQERNVLGVGDSCTGCLGEDERGWVPIGELIPVGSRDCLRNCNCTFVFRNSVTGATDEDLPAEEPAPTAEPEHGVDGFLRSDLARRVAAREIPSEFREGQFQQAGDGWLHALNEHYGYGGPARVLDHPGGRLDPMEWGARGVASESHVQDFMTGELFPGRGIYGNGTYMSRAAPPLRIDLAGGQVFTAPLADNVYDIARSTAWDYASSDSETLLRIRLRPEARTVAFSEIEQEIEAARRQFSSETIERGFAMSPAEQTAWLSDRAALEDFMFRDIGRYGVIQGYDAIIVEGRGIPGSENWIVLLNRTVVDVVRERFDDANYDFRRNTR